MSNALGSERELREEIVLQGRSLFDRGLTAGSSGNLSIRLPDGILITPTNSCLGRLQPDDIARLDSVGNHQSGLPPSKEAFLHQSYFRSRDREHAVVHLHSTWSVAVSCLRDLDPENALPAITPYFVMRVGRLPLIPYFPPGDRGLAEAVAETALTAKAILLANHGPVIGGVDLHRAVDAIEELEETAKLFLMLRGLPTQFLTEEQTKALSS
ncbi:MAG: 3-oxo-tetronate 4-phosphate decarboxylase [Planctomycetota bacterium]